MDKGGKDRRNPLWGNAIVSRESCPLGLPDLGCSETLAVVAEKAPGQQGAPGRLEVQTRPKCPLTPKDYQPWGTKWSRNASDGCKDSMPSQVHPLPSSLGL